MSLRWIQENQEAPICDEESSDIDDSSDDDTDDEIDHCSNVAEDETGEHRREKRETFRHPTTTVTPEILREEASTQGRNPNVPMDNSICGSIMKLFSSTYFHLAILPSGKVQGYNEECNPYVILKISSVSIGVVQIQGFKTGLYLAFNGKGRLYGERNKDKDNTTWQHLINGSYYSYRSLKYKGWYVGIKKNGRPKNGNKTAGNQRAVQFLPRK